MSTRLRVRYWVAVMSKDQVYDAMKNGYCEFKNGAKLPFKHVNPNSWFIYYSPGTKPLKVLREEGREVGEAVQAFTAIGQVLPGDPYSIDIGNDTIVYRRHARYVPNVSDASIFPMIGKLSFLRNLSKYELWGTRLRKGLIEVLKSDFYLLCEAMNINMPKRHHQIFNQSNVNITKKVEEQKEVHQMPLDNSEELKGDITERASTIEGPNALDPNSDIIDSIVVEGLQQDQKTNSILELKSNDMNEINKSTQTAIVDECGTSVNPKQDTYQESPVEMPHQLQVIDDSNNKENNDKENNANVELRQLKES